MTIGNAGYPIGGSLKMIGLIEDNYKKLGGNIRFRAKVRQILVENNCAVGVILENGEHIQADLVVSAADGYSTIFKMLEEKFVDDKIKKIYETYKPFPSYVQVSLGVNAGLKDEPGFLNIMLDNEIEIDPETRVNNLSFRIFNYDPTFAPPGKTSVVSFIASYNYEYWVSLRERERAHYYEQKNRIAREVMAVFERRFPAAQGKIEVVDIATPATVIRYTDNWKGSMEGWLLTPATGFRQLPAVLPNLKNFYLVGHWISPGGGLPSGLLTARAVSRIICHDLGVHWKTG
jgi:phytoene dehydrogenase-like protein